MSVITMEPKPSIDCPGAELLPCASKINLIHHFIFVLVKHKAVQKSAAAHHDIITVVNTFFYGCITLSKELNLANVQASEIYYKRR